MKNIKTKYHLPKQSLSWAINTRIWLQLKSPVPMHLTVFGSPYPWILIKPLFWWSNMSNSNILKQRRSQPRFVNIFKIKKKFIYLFNYQGEAKIYINLNMTDVSSIVSNDPQVQNISSSSKTVFSGWPLEQPRRLFKQRRRKLEKHIHQDWGRWMFSSVWTSS